MRLAPLDYTHTWLLSLLILCKNTKNLVGTELTAGVFKSECSNQVFKIDFLEIGLNILNKTRGVSQSRL